MKNMKKFSLVLLLAFSTFVSFSIAEETDEKWEKHKSEKFHKLTEEERKVIADALPDAPTATAAKPRKVLLFYRCNGYIHSSIPWANAAVEEMATKTGAFTVEITDEYEVFTKENLANYDCVLLNNASHMEFPKPEQMNAFMDFVIEGKGLAGIHAAGDNFQRHPDCLALIGGEFGGHPWGSGGTWAFKLNDPAHPLNAAFEGKGFWFKDEIYQYKPESYVGTDTLRVLLSLDMTKDKVSSKIDDGPREVPVSWIRTAGEGRVFYTNLGHNESTYRDPAVMRHMLDGIQYAIGDLAADATATSKAPATKPALAPEEQPK